MGLAAASGRSRSELRAPPPRVLLAAASTVLAVLGSIGFALRADAPSPGGPRRASPRADDGWRAIAPALHLVEAGLPAEVASDGDVVVVPYRFGAFVRSVVRPRAFELRAYAADDVATAVAARVSRDSPDRVEVVFAAGTDVQRYSVATVARGAVVDETGAPNAAGSAALGSAARAVPDGVGPVLADAAPVPTLGRVRFRFDQPLDPTAPPVPGRLVVLTAEGRPMRAREVIEVDGWEVEARFAGRISAAARYAVERGAVRGRSGRDAPPSSVGEDTAAPKLVAVRETGDVRQLDFVFDAAVVAARAERFVVHADDGTHALATGITRPSAEVVRASFPGIRDLRRDVALAGVEGGAVRGSDDRGVANAPAAAHLHRGAVAGSTAGPDLLGATISSSGEVELRFDEPVAEGQPVGRSAVVLVLSSGELVPARFVVGPRHDRLLVVHDGPMASRAAGVLVRRGAVRDAAGNPNLEAALVEPPARVGDRWS